MSWLLSYDIAQTFDERDIPPTDRFCVLPPAEYYKLAESATRTVDVDFNPQGNGSFASGKIQTSCWHTCDDVKQRSRTNRSAVSGENNTYSGS